MIAAPKDGADAVTLERVSLGYGRRRAVENVVGTIVQGTMLALVGPNGAGKSTLLKALAGLHRPMAGKIRGLPGHVAYLAQHAEIDRSFPISVLDFVTMGLWREIGLWNRVSTSQLERSRAMLARVGLGGFEDRRIGALSGGQLRRAFFARAALQDASFILLDEPFAGIDAATTSDLLGMTRTWHAEGRTVIAALHDLDQARAQFPLTMLLARRVIAWGESHAVLSEQNLAVAQAVGVTAGDDAPVAAEQSADV